MDFEASSAKKIFCAPVTTLPSIIILAGLSYMLMHIFNVGVGMTFSGGAIDLTLFGILQGTRTAYRKHGANRMG